MNKWQKIGLAVGMGTAVITTTHLINSIIFKSSTANNYTGKRIRSNYQWKFGNIAYITAGSGSPLLLIHDLNSYSSSYEWEQTINSFAKNHKVYAIDLLGCGHSDKPNLTYTTFMYTQLINDFVLNVIRSKTDVVATAGSTPIVIMAAFNNHALFNKIILVSPLSVEDALKGPDNLSGIRRHILNVPVIGTSVYNILFNRPSLRKLLSKNFIDGRIPADYINACHENAHLGDASAKYLFISTECNFTTVTISKALSELDNCIYMINGMHNNNDVIDEYMHINPAIENVMIQDAKKLPQVEQPMIVGRSNLLPQQREISRITSPLESFSDLFESVSSIHATEDPSCVTPERIIFITDAVSQIYTADDWYKRLDEDTSTWSCRSCSTV